MSISEVTISTGSIKLGQFVKLANFVGTGGEAKQAISAGDFTVNGEVETRRGATLHHGDVVAYGNARAQVASTPEQANDMADEPNPDEDWDPSAWEDK